MVNRLARQGLRKAEVPLSDPRTILGANVRRRRRAAGLSQEELASRAGLHRTYVSSLERGERNVAVENIFALAAALGCSPGALLDEALPTAGGDDGPQS